MASRSSTWQTSSVVAVVVARDLEVQRREVLAGQRLAALGLLVKGQLELGELGLPEQRRAQAVEQRAQQEQAGGVVLGAIEHVVNQQILVERRRHLGDEDRVVGGRVRLRAVRQERVHRVPRLVRQRRQVLVAAVEVEQLIRVHAVDARRIRARPLARRRQVVGPPALEPLAQRLRVRLAQRRQRVERDRARLVRREAHVHARHERHVQVLVAQLSSPSMRLRSAR